MKCPNCQKEVKDEDALYCPHCGLNLEESMVIEEEQEGVGREKRIKVMRKLSKIDKEDLLSRRIPREKITLIKDDLRGEFLGGNLEELPLLLKDCVFQQYSKKSGEKDPRKRILCSLIRERRRCIKEICPLYQIWKKS